MKKQLLIVVAALLLFSTICWSQEAKPIDQFGDVNCEDLMARLDGFAIEIQNESQTHFGYVVIYEGAHDRVVYGPGQKSATKTFLPLEGEANLFGETIRNYLTSNRGLENNSVMIVSGGFREKFGVELWIVPRGGKTPEATPTKDALKYRKGIPTDICNGM